MNQHETDPERRQAEAQDRAGHDRLAGHRVRLESAQRPSVRPSTMAMTMAVSASSIVRASVEDQFRQQDVYV